MVIPGWLQGTLATLVIVAVVIQVQSIMKRVKEKREEMKKRLDLISLAIQSIDNRITSLQKALRSANEQITDLRSGTYSQQAYERDLPPEIQAQDSTRAERLRELMADGHSPEEADKLLAQEEDLYRQLAQAVRGSS